MFVFFWIYSALVLNSSLTEDSFCAKTKSYISDGKLQYYNETVCCDNYEMKANECVECVLGFHRPFGHTSETCIPCEKDTYGKKCAFVCFCKLDERCNSMSGCVSKNAANDVHTEVFSKASEDSTASTDTKFVTTSAVSQISESTDTNSIKPTESANVKKSTGFNRQRILYFVVGGAMTIVSITFISFVYTFYRKRQNMSIMESMLPAGQTPSQSVTVPEEEEVVEMNMLDHDYEEIDETSMINDNLNIDNNIEESETDSNSASTISPTEDDEGYLHPYHSLVHLKKMENFVSDGQHSETDLRANVLLQNPYDHLQIPIKISTTSGYESMEMKERLPTSSNKSVQEHVVENTVDKSCFLDDTNIRIYAVVKRKNQPSQQDQINRLS